MKKALISLLIIVLIVGGSLAAIGYMKMKNAAEVVAQIETRPVARRTIEKLVTANGKVASNRDVEIKCQASGKVISLPYDISDRVKPGDLIMELDPIDQERSLEQAKAQLEMSKTRVAQAELSYQIAELNLETSRLRVEADLASARARASDALAKGRRVQDLFNEKLASREELETAQTSAAQAQAQVQSAEAAKAELQQQAISLESRKHDIATAKNQLTQDTARYDLAVRQLEYTKVYVPQEANATEQPDFRVSALTVQLGSVVQSGSSGFSGGTTVMTLSDVSHLYVLASVDESDIGQVADPAEGAQRQKVRITVDAYRDEPFEGQVVRVARKGSNTSNVVTFEVKIEVTSPNRKLLRPEMTATANIIAESRVDALAIPVSAFARQSAQDQQAQQATSTPGTAMSSGSAGSAANTDVTADPPATAQAGRGPAGRGGDARTGSTAPLMPLRTRPQKGTVEVLTGPGQTETRLVIVGLTDNEYFEVLEGLDEGEEVAVSSVGGGDSRWRGQTANQQMMRGSNSGRGTGAGRGR